MIDNNFVIDEFISDLRTQGKCEATLSSYSVELERCLATIGKRIINITSEDMLKYLEDNYFDKKAINTTNRFISISKNFFKFCLKKNYILKFPVKPKRWSEKPDNPTSAFLEDNQEARLKENSESLPLMEKVILNLFISTGMRKAEVSNLKISDINLENRSIEVIGKGGKSRTVFFNEKCKLELRKYLNNLSTKLKDDWLFLNKKGEKLNDKEFYNIVSKELKKLGIEKPCGPHVLRHNFATKLYEKGCELRVIADLLGHEFIETTLIYAKIPTERERYLDRKFLY